MNIEPSGWDAAMVHGNRVVKSDSRVALLARWCQGSKVDREISSRLDKPCHRKHEYCPTHHEDLCTKMVKRKASASTKKGRLFESCCLDHAVFVVGAPVAQARKWYKSAGLYSRPDSITVLSRHMVVTARCERYEYLGKSRARRRRELRPKHETASDGSQRSGTEEMESGPCSSVRT